jgi:hypothetical protein
MHWILMVGMHMNLSLELGRFETLEKCDKAADQFMVMFAKSVGIVAGCVEEKQNP